MGHCKKLSFDIESREAKGAELVDACRTSYLSMQVSYIGERTLPHFGTGKDDVLMGGSDSDVYISTAATR